MPEEYGGKWTMIEYDFDGDFGQDVCAIEFMGSTNSNKDYPSWEFEQWGMKNKNHLTEILITNDPTRFNKIMKRFVEEAFNPGLLFPRIDELKDFIRDSVKRDKTPVNGKVPGILNEKATTPDYTFEQWEANSEFTNIGPSASSSGYGLKFWILNRYRKVCTTYKLDCDPEYMDINYYYDIDREVEGPINTSFSFGGFGFGGNNNKQNQTPRTTQSQPPKDYSKTKTTIQKTTTATINSDTSTATNTSSSSKSCAAAALGYPCCSDNAQVVYQDETGDWGVENSEWCGITPESEAKDCWSKKLGYRCCSKCQSPIYVDDDGNWGVEYNDWCGILTSC